MNERDFESLLSATRNEDIWDIRLAECKAIIAELVAGDFEDIPYGTGKIFIQIARLPSDTMAVTEDGKLGENKIILNRACWEKNPNFSKAGLRQILAHECLHIETGLGDRDPRFKQMARERKIDIWRI